MIRAHHYRTPRDQKGVVLVMTLAILLIVTIVGVSSVQMTSVLSSMVRNTNDGDVAFRAAEAGLKVAEAAIEAAINEDSDFEINAGGIYEELTIAQEAVADANGQTGARWERDLTWTNANSIGVAFTLSQPGSGPRYIVEHVKAVASEGQSINQGNANESTGNDTTQVFRISVKGIGRPPTSQVYLQATYGKKF